MSVQQRWEVVATARNWFIGTFAPGCTEAPEHEPFMDTYMALFDSHALNRWHTRIFLMEVWTCAFQVETESAALAARTLVTLPRLLVSTAKLLSASDPEIHDDYYLLEYMFDDVLMHAAREWHAQSSNCCLDRGFPRHLQQEAFHCKSSAFVGQLERLLAQRRKFVIEEFDVLTTKSLAALLRVLSLWTGSAQTSLSRCSG
jgi:hypothetical protein